MYLGSRRVEGHSRDGVCVSRQPVGKRAAAQGVHVRLGEETGFWVGREPGRLRTLQGGPAAADHSGGDTCPAVTPSGPSAP